METNAESLKDRKEQSFGAVKVFSVMISFILIFYLRFSTNSAVLLDLLISSFGEIHPGH